MPRDQYTCPHPQSRCREVARRTVPMGTGTMLEITYMCDDCGALFSQYE